MKRFIVCQGDSLTDPYTNMGPEWTRWTETLAGKLRALGCDVMVSNIGKSGAKTDDLGKGMLRRFFPFINGTPDVGVIWGGTNDIRTPTSITRSGSTATVTSSSHAYTDTALIDVVGANQAEYNVTGAQISNVTTNTFDYTVSGTPATPATGTLRVCLQSTRNIRAILKWYKFGCLGAYRSQTSLPDYGQEGDRYVILYDTSTTGGRAALANSSDQLPTIAGSVDSTEPTVWEWRGGSGVAGWGRVATADTTPTHVSRLLVIGQHYLNYSSGGDTLATPYANYNATDGVRSFQIAAAAAEGAVYVDLYTYLRNLIVAGTNAQGDYAWHRADGDVHLSTYGHALVADCILASILEQGWLAWLRG